MIHTYSEAINFINRTTNSNRQKFSGIQGLSRQHQILKFLDHPQDKIKTIHIAGTSGKGSTSFYLSSLLISHGFSVGLALSPHLIDIRERLLVNNKVISKKEFVYYLNQIIPAIKKTEKLGFGSPGYFELLVILSTYVFFKKQVDYIVLETGVGGLLDSSNTISNPNKIAVITKIGLDHTKTLGPNISSIASQKAGIIHLKSPVFSINQFTAAQKVIDFVANQNQTSVTYIKPNINYKNVCFVGNSLTYDFSFKNLNIPKLAINTIGLYQAENSALSLSVFYFLSSRDKFALSIIKIRRVFEKIKFYGRGDLRFLNHKPIILDGAHNPQKIRSLIKSLKVLYPQQKFTFILAFKKRHDFIQMAKCVSNIANEIIISSPLDSLQSTNNYLKSHLSIPKIFQKINFSSYEIIPNQKIAFKKAISTNSPVVVTGSLYLLSEIYPLLNKIKK